MAELDRLDREYGLGAMPPSAPHRTRRRSTSNGRALSLSLTAALVSAIVVWSPAESMLSLRRLVGFDDDRASAVPNATRGEGTYSFGATQRGTGEPVAYDPCREIEVLVNPAGAPPNYDDLVDLGLAHTAAATGLKLVRVGLTDARTAYSAVITRRSPILIAWATPEEVPDLAGDVAGVGGSVATGPPGRLRYVTGEVFLDRDVFAAFSAQEAPFAQAILDHELAHVVGLGHVDDPGELMHHDNVGRTTYGSGDREGLARLGSVECW